MCLFQSTFTFTFTCLLLVLYTNHPYMATAESMGHGTTKGRAMIPDGLSTRDEARAIENTGVNSFPMKLHYHECH